MSKVKSGKTTVSLLLKLLQNGLRPRFEEAIKGIYNKDYSFPPFAVLVDITTRCNLGCPWCIDRYVISDREIPTERMLGLLDEFKTLDILSIVYFGGGEPLFHKEIGTVLKKTWDLDIDYALNTNGILLHKIMSLVGMSCSWTRVSWDAASSNVYKEMHLGGDFFSQILRNTENLAKIANGTVGVSFVVMNENVREINKAANLAKRIGCDFIQFKPKYTPLESNKRILNCYQADISAKIREELVLAQEQEDENFAILVTDSLKTVLDGTEINQNKVYTYCAAQQFITLINPCGVYVCPNWRGMPEKKIGDILSSSLAEIWGSDKRRKVIEELNPTKECGLNCLRHNTNVLASVLLQAERMGLDLLPLIKETLGEEISDRFFL